MTSPWMTALALGIAAASTAAAGYAAKAGTEDFINLVQGKNPLTERDWGRTGTEAGITVGTAGLTAGLGSGIAGALGSNATSIAGQSGAATPSISSSIVKDAAVAARSGLTGAGTGALSAEARGQNAGRGALIGGLSGAAAGFTGAATQQALAPSRPIPPAGSSAEPSLMGGGPRSTYEPFMRTDAGMTSDAMPTPRDEGPMPSGIMQHYAFQGAADKLVSSVRSTAPRLASQGSSGLVAQALQPPPPPRPPMSPYASGYMPGQYGGVPNPQAQMPMGPLTPPQLPQPFPRY